MTDGINIRSGDHLFHLSADVAEAVRAHVASGSAGAVQRGVLFGTGHNDLYEVLDARPLTPDTQPDGSLAYLALFAQLFERPPSDALERQLWPVGWYSSRQHGELELSPADAMFDRSLFGEQRLILFAERLPGGHIALTTPQSMAGVAATAARKIGWPANPKRTGMLAAVVCLVALIVGGVLYWNRRHTDEQERAAMALSEPRVAEAPAAVVVLPPPVEPVSQPISAPNAVTERPAQCQDLTPQLERLQRDLEIEVARNRRLEATLRILRDERPMASLGRREP